MARNMSGRKQEWASVETLLCTAAETDCTSLGAPVVRQELNQGTLFSSPSSSCSLSQLFVHPTEIALCCPKIFLRTLFFYLFWKVPSLAISSHSYLLLSLDIVPTHSCLLLSLVVLFYILYNDTEGLA
ncbi:hypothetical protein ACN38_g3877 [Penicillium nordicum]|uniref:Uncharacterized protein n=1 Tax=Penicillium nordicum TaxID=229535 RepID=A0A0M8PD36_9EURO|nr:hypothetical protein ACN38_g3877 [Penicillium nordicum]